MLLLLLFIVFLATAVSYIWVKGVTYTKQNKTECNQKDFIHTASGRDVWDDEWNAHTEGEF